MMMQEIAALPVTSAEYVRRSGGWDFCAAYIAGEVRKAGEKPVSFLPRNDTHGTAYKAPDRTQDKN